MASFAEFMAESYRANVPLTWNLASRNHATASFTVDAVKVIVFFEQREPDGPWHVLFELDKGEASSTEVAHSAFSVFNGVFQAVVEFAETCEPDRLVLASDRKELARVYLTYLRRESATLKKLGYETVGPYGVERHIEFTVRRVMPLGWKQ